MTNHSSGGLQSIPQTAGIDEASEYSTDYIISAGQVSSGLNIYSGDYLQINGSAYNTHIYSNGHVEISNGGTASKIIADNGRIALGNGIASDVTIAGNQAYMNIGAFGSAVSASLISGGRMYVYYAGWTNSVTVNNGGIMYISSSGVANNTTVNSGGIMMVQSRGLANLATVNNGGSAVIHSGAADSVCIMAAGVLTVSAGGYAKNTIVNYGGIITVSAGGTASVVYNPWSGRVNSRSGAKIEYLSREYNIYYGGIVSGLLGRFGELTDFTVTSGNSAIVYAGGKAANTTLSSGGFMYISSGGIHSGSLMINSGAAVNLYQGATVDFSLAGRSSSDDYLINDLSLINGIPTYTITVSANQQPGLYKLAQGAKHFTGTISVGNGIINYGTITVNGDELKYNGAKYTLLQYDDNLLLDVASIPAAVFIYSSGNLVSSCFSANSAVLSSGGNNSMHVSADGVVYNTSLYYGSMCISSGGMAENTSVRGAFMYISSGGSAVSTLVSGGHMYVSRGGYAENINISGISSQMVGFADVFSGGSAKEAVLNSNGSMQIWSGGTVDGVTVNKGATLIVSSGGTAANVAWVPVEGHLVSRYGATVTYADTVSGVYYGSQNTLLSRADVMSGESVELYYRMYVMNKGTASDTKVKRGTMFVYSGGKADGLFISGGTVTLWGGAWADNVKISSGGKLYVSGGAEADNITVLSGGEMYLYSAAAAEQVLIQRGGCFGGFIFSEDISLKGIYGSAVLSSGAVLSEKQLHLASGAVNSNTSIISGSMHVSSGASAVSTYVTDSGRNTVTVSSGGFACDTDVSGNYTSMSVLSGGVAERTSVLSSGKLEIMSGGTAVSTFIENYTSMYISSGGTAEQIHLSAGSSGYIFLYSGGNASDITVCGGETRVFGNALRVSAVGGVVSVYSGGTVDSAAVSGSGWLNAAGAANAVAVNSKGTFSIISGGTANRAAVNTSGYMYVRGEANSTTVNSFGSMKIFSGGTANNTTLEWAGYMCVSSSGLASNTINNGVMDVLSGGTAGETTVNSGGRLFVSSGGKSLGIRENGGYVLVEAGANVTFAANTIKNLQLNEYDSATLHSGTSASSTDIGKLGQLQVFSGGIAENTRVNDGGWLEVSSGGLMKNVTLNSGGVMTINSGGSALSIKENGGEVRVLQGAEVTFVSNTIRNLVVSDYDTATVHSNTLAANTKVISRGILKIVGGRANNTKVVSSGTVYVSGGICYSAAVQEYSSMYAYSGGTFSSTSAGYRGSVFVSSGGAAYDTVVGDFGNLFIYSGGMLGGTLSISNNDAVVSAYSGAVIDFTAAGRKPQDGYLINDLSLISGSPVYTVTVSADMESGIYKLAQGAENFNQTITVGNGSGNYGTLEVNGETVRLNGADYQLLLDDGNLTLSVIHLASIENPVAEADITTATNKVVTVSAVFNSASVVNEYSLDNENWFAYTTGIKFTANGTVYFRSGDAAGNYSEVVSYTVSNIDTTAPDAPSAAADVTEQTNKDVIVTAVFSNDTVTGEYSFDNKTWQTYASGVKFSDNGTVYFRGTDAAGNCSEVTSYTVDNIDKDAPEKPAATADITTPTRQNVTVTAAFSDDSVTKEYSFDNASWQSYTGNIVMADNGNIYFRAADAAGNISSSVYTVSNIDRIAPVKPSAITDITAVTASNVTVSAAFSSDSVTREYSPDNKNWYTYTGSVVMTENGTVYFRGADAAGNVSDVASCIVSNIDKTVPAAPTEISCIPGNYSVTVDWQDITDSGAAGTQGYWVRYGKGKDLSGEKEVFVTGSCLTLTDLSTPGTWHMQIKTQDNVGNVSAWSSVMSFIYDKPAPQNLSGSASQVSWSANLNAVSYTVSFSQDNFATAFDIENTSTALDIYSLPSGTYQWQVRETGSLRAADGKNIVSTAGTASETLRSTANGNKDLFFAEKHGVWAAGYVAQHLGFAGGWNGTAELAAIAGKNKFTDRFIGSADANVVVLTDDANGDALFADNIYDSLGNANRITLIDEILAGSGDDIIDMTSTRWQHANNMTYKGGAGDDVIWSGNGSSNILYGDSGNDRLVGGSQNDHLIGGSGNDSMHGGGGSDIFCFGGNWGNDTVEQLADGNVTLWFESGSLDNWNSETLTYTDGDNSVTVSGVKEVTLNFGGDISSLPAGAFSDYVSEKIYEERTKGILA